MILYNKSIRPILLSVIVGVLIYMGAIIATDFETVWGSVLQLGLYGWLSVLGLALLGFIFRFLRWQYYLKIFKYQIPMLSHFGYYIAGFAFTATPGKAGEVIRSLYLKPHGVPYKHSLAAFFSERLIDVIVLVLFSMTLTYVFENALLSVSIMLSFILFVLLFIHSHSLYRIMDWINARVKSKKANTLFEHGVAMIKSSSILLTLHPLSIGLLIGMMGWVSECFAFYLILNLLGTDVSLLLAIGIYSFSLLIGAISLIPGGLGTTEATLMLLLTVNNVETNIAAAAIIICRVATLWFAIGLGLVSVFWLGVGRLEHKV